MAGNEIEFFDVNATFGRRKEYRGKFFWRKKALLEAMEEHGIHRALVYHSLTKELHPAEGNPEVVRDTEDQPALFPCWGGLPGGWLENSPEMQPVEEFIGEMQENNVRAVRVFAHETVHRFALGEWSMGELYGGLESTRIPILLDYGENSYKGVGRIDWDEVYDLCQNHPDLPVILMEVGYRTCRYLSPLFSRCPNLRIDISRFMTHRGVEYICREFGARRLIFGSRLPFQNPGAVMALVLYARISMEEKMLIAGCNLEDLMNGVRW